MPSQLPDYSDSVRAAVADYWNLRRSQADESEGRGVFNERMVRERLLDAACVVLADKDSATVRFPSNSVSFQTFAAAIHGRCLQFMTTNPDIDWSGRG